MKVRIEKSVARGTVKAPPSKSYAHRLLICSALAKGQSTVCGISQSVDMEATLSCIISCGVEFEKNGDTVSVNGGIKDIGKEFNCYESGSTLRFFIPISLVKGGKRVFFGSQRLMSRGLSVYEEIFKEQNISFTRDETSLTVEGELKSGTFYVRGDISSQFISGLLFALPLLKGDSKIVITTKLESSAYVDITIEALKTFGVEVIKNGNELFVSGSQEYKCANVEAEGDLSNSAFLDAFNYLGGDVTVQGLNEGSIQGDGIYKEYFELINNGTPVLDLSDCPDLGPIVFALAGVKNGAVINGTQRLKIKESDRVLAMATELECFGVEVSDKGDYVTVKGGDLHPPKRALSSHNDHRIVMALSVILTLFGGEIEGAEAVSKSYPDFFDRIRELGIKCEVTDK